MGTVAYGYLTLLKGFFTRRVVSIDNSLSLEVL